MTCEETLTWLKRYQLPRSVGDALEALWELASRTRILVLYQAFFLEEFAQSTAAIQASPDVGYSPREWEFFHLVDRLFPFSPDQFDSDEERRTTFWLDLIGMEGDGAFEDYRPGWQLLMLLHGMPLPGDIPRDDAALAVLLGGVESAHLLGPALRAWNPDVDIDAFLANCAASNGPLAAIPFAFSMLAYDTGSVFLDSSPDEGLDAAFDLETFQALRDDWAAVRPSYEAVSACLDWLEANPAHPLEVIHLWNHSLPH